MRFIKKAETDLENIETMLDEELEEGRSDIAMELTELLAEIDDKQEEIDELDDDIAQKQQELDIVVSDIKKKETEAKVLPAGLFIVGVDIPADRYSITTNGTRGSNFFVYNEEGRSVVNTIISSKEGHGVKEYVAFLNDGMIIEANDTFKYVPVE